MIEQRILPRETGEGDREAVEGAQPLGTPPPSRRVFAARHLPRLAGEEGGR
ncbi:hypothetical protein EIB18_14100 [Caulobacter vibrioides]|uniref:Uncharacterized protein n=1 Tax=Caulobacter vibrioides (strain NA1000 / CB15N) TaxID=565050 RepID=A0A0H3IWK3_CAUVN|nr:hypothetical protein [Caulobacter vibrioides]YP_009020547.1 hypothetical protein CCNA_03975 [Caulobacter vibrioides NA1000]AHI88578.1 hypothetical protein CCNA_03975 [Caulobacter vibrioides NA1000]AVG21559.1 hypothetical protein CA608_20365 [Caulobacter vibrioides]AVH77094.1 hypothetical protein CA607_20505 [Caulobacter vibrioides]AZH13730.1 hypothetical protein EIB18_14100 [Caulobacter vibrioides]PLR07733.1 hypothetical protein CVUC_19500 [Caulobacter vibrioides]